MHTFFLALLMMGASLAAAEPLRVSGDFRLKEFKPLPYGGGTMIFQAEHQTGRFDELHLEARQSHLALEKGKVFHLSAEVVAVQGSVAEASQILIQFSKGDQKIPVWLLSSKYPGMPLRGARYLEMHAPSNDYLLL